MLKHLTALAVVAALVASVGPVCGDGGKGPGSNSGSGKGGNANAPLKVEGIVMATTANADGTTSVTIATGRATTTVVTVNAATKVEVNEAHATIADVDVGDFAEADVTASGVATKLEAVEIP